MHQQFEESEWIRRTEFTNLANRLNEQQYVFPYTMVYKLFRSQTFEDYIYSCTKAQIDSAVIEALQMVKEDYPCVSVAQSKYRY